MGGRWSSQPHFMSAQDPPETSHQAQPRSWDNFRPRHKNPASVSPVRSSLQLSIRSWNLRQGASPRWIQAVDLQTLSSAILPLRPHYGPNPRDSYQENASCCPQDDQKMARPPKMRHYLCSPLPKCNWHTIIVRPQIQGKTNFPCIHLHFSGSCHGGNPVDPHRWRIRQEPEDQTV